MLFGVIKCYESQVSTMGTASDTDVGFFMDHDNIQAAFFFFLHFLFQILF